MHYHPVEITHYERERFDRLTHVTTNSLLRLLAMRIRGRVHPVVLARPLRAHRRRHSRP